MHVTSLVTELCNCNGEPQVVCSACYHLYVILLAQFIRSIIVFLYYQVFSVVLRKMETKCGKYLCLLRYAPILTLTLCNKVCSVYFPQESVSSRFHVLHDWTIGGGDGVYDSSVSSLFPAAQLSDIMLKTMGILRV